MAWKIIFNYQDGGQLKISKSSGKLTKEKAEEYRKEYARRSNDGGTVYTSPYKSCKPISLDEYINGTEKVR